MLEISTDKIGYVILRSREIDMKVSPNVDADGVDTDDRGSEAILEDQAGDATRHELTAILQGMNVDERAESDRTCLDRTRHLRGRRAG